MITSSGEWHQRYCRQATWTSSLRKYLFNKVKINDARRILEVGCGTGAVLSEFNFSTSLIYGLDLDRSHLSLCRTHTLSALLTQGDALTLPYNTGCFDLVYSHFLLLWLTQPLQALAEMQRVTQPGGYVLAIAEPDYGGRIDYPGELAHLGQLQALALDRQGANPSIGRRLSELFHQAGLENIQTGVLGGEWQAIPTQEERESEWQTLESDLAEIIPPVQLSQYREIDEKAWLAGSRVLYVPTFYASGQVPI